MLHPDCRLRLVHALRSRQLAVTTPGLPDPFSSTTFRTFTTTSQRSSHIGSAPLSVPASVDFQILSAPLASSKIPGARRGPGSRVQVKGPLGELTYPLSPGVKVDYNEGLRKATVSVQDAEVKHQRAMWGTTRAYLSSHILGVSEGHTCILRLVGVGYRATIEASATTVKPAYPNQPFVSLKVGYSHPIELGVPLGVKASAPQPTRILLEGVEKEVVKEFAAKIRKWRVPEPYKGKGIFVDGETIRLKAKKIK